MGVDEAKRVASSETCFKQEDEGDTVHLLYPGHVRDASNRALEPAASDNQVVEARLHG